MIIDSHAYCFEPADSLPGYASVAEHLRWVQAGQAGHYQPALRLRDRAAGPSYVLAPKGKRGLSDLPDLNFRIDAAAGRVVWTYDGGDYTKRYYPPNAWTRRALRAESKLGADAGELVLRRISLDTAHRRPPRGLRGAKPPGVPKP